MPKIGTVGNGLAGRLSQQRKLFTTTAPHVMIIARAGTGKTTSLIEGLRLMRGQTPRIQPSEQQQAIWDQMLLSRGVRSTCFVSFSRSTTAELKERVPQGVYVKTLHGMGFQTISRAYDLPNDAVDRFRVSTLLAKVMERDPYTLRGDQPKLVKLVEELTSLCKQTLAGWDGSSLLPSDNLCWTDILQDLMDYYTMEAEESDIGLAQQLVPLVLHECTKVAADQCIDYDDMPWIPVVNNLKMYENDLLLVDEAQDLNKCQQQLALKAGRRLIMVGDPSQSIYGFAGADASSMRNMEETLRGLGGVEILQLNVTRRCGKAIVREAQKIVPDFAAHESNPEGVVRHSNYRGQKNYTAEVRDGDFILCRINAPLVGQCFKFLQNNQKATIAGRDIGEALISTIQKMQDNGCGTIPELIEKLDEWYKHEVLKEKAKKNPNEHKIISLGDRKSCLECFCENAQTIDEIIQKISAIFNDDTKGGIRLMSLHKSKGLESRRVFFLTPSGAECPHPMAKSGWAQEQEMNLRYVGTTRAIEELVFVK